MSQAKTPRVPEPAPRNPTWFTHFARWTSFQAGRPLTFLVAVLTILAWAITGPLFHYSDTWQLAINTGTTIVTFLMVFLIQNTQNRDSQALHLKLDELIRAMRGARNSMLDLDCLTDEELQKIQASFAKMAANSKQSPPRKVISQRPPASPG